MVTVALAGGTGNVGRTIRDALKESQKHQVIVLTRKTPEDDDGIPTFVVDYSDVDKVSRILESNNVHTVISSIAVMEAISGKSEVDLVKAAEKSSVTKRFVASNWGAATPADLELQIPHQKYRLQTLEALRKTNLEWTEFYNGFFLDYYGMPHIQSHLTPLAWVVDMAHKTAAIPGTGNEPLSLTYTKDLAKFVVAALDLERWEHSLSCYGDSITWNEFIKLAEKATGSKFNVTYDRVEKLQKREITELPSHEPTYAFFPKPMFQAMLATFGLYTVNGIFDMPQDGKSLNKRFPDIKTTTVEEVLSLWKRE